MAVYKSKKPTKDGRAWYFRMYKNGKQFESQKYFTKKEAQDEEALFKIKRDNPFKISFFIVAKSYFEEIHKIKRESTYYTYEKEYYKHIHDFFKDYDTFSIDVTIIKKWAKEMENSKLAVSSLNKIRYVLQNIFDHAIRNYNLKYNPVKLYGTFKEKNDKIITQKLKYITKEEFDKFIEVIDEPMWKTFFITMWYTGCRKGELQALTWTDIKDDSIFINKSLSVKNKEKYLITTTKTSTNRAITMNKILKETLIEYKKIIMKYSNYSNDWFVFGNINPLPQTTIDRYKDKYFKLSGVRRITNHEFRHSIITHLVNSYIQNCNSNNISIDTEKFFLMLSKRDGHSVEVLKRYYMHLFENAQDEIVELLDNN